MLENTELKKVTDRRVHMANERTFLAWIRTSIGIMAFGFVVERFALFMESFSLFINDPFFTERSLSSHESSKILGIILVGLGTIIGFLAFIRYKNVERQIKNDTYRTSSALSSILIFSVLMIGIFLVIYLIRTRI